MALESLPGTRTLQGTLLGHKSLQPCTSPGRHASAIPPLHATQWISPGLPAATMYVYYCTCPHIGAIPYITFSSPKRYLKLIVLSPLSYLSQPTAPLFGGTVPFASLLPSEGTDTTRVRASTKPRYARPGTSLSRNLPLRILRSLFLLPGTLHDFSIP